MAHKSGNPTWVDYPSTATLVTAARLEAAENAIDTHTHVAAEVTDFDAAVGTKVDVATLNNAFGAHSGQPLSPWSPETTIGSELWQVANFINGGAGYNTTTLTPSLTPNGTGQTSITRVKYGSTVGGFEGFRLEFDWTAPSNGWGGISVKVVDDGGTMISGTNEQLMIANGTPGPKSGHYLIDLAPGVGSGSLNFEIKLRLENNSTTGSALAVSNVSLKQSTTDAQRPLLVSKQYSTGTQPFVYVSAKDVVTDSWKMAEFDHAPEGDLTPYSFNTIRGFYDDQPFNTAPADPAMKRATVANSADPGNQFISATPAYVTLRSGNNDQIHYVWNGTSYEYRGNVHNGEFTRTTPGVSVQIDRGAGWVSYTPTNQLVPVRRVKVSIPTEFRRSTDGTTPYCSVDRTHVYFPDGMCRTDRTTTFSAATQFADAFEWMASYATDTPYIGRLGRGLTILGETDSHPYITPNTPTAATATTGGTLAAATYSYRVTALTPYGESTPSTAVTQATTGTTSTVTISWSAVTSATGYRVYGRTAGVEKLLTTTSSLSYVDTGSAVPLGDLPIVNTARLYNSTTFGTMAQSSAATWAVYRDPRTGWCHGNIYDRESILARTGVAATHLRLMRGNGIQKNYTNLVFSSGTSYTVPSGTVWSATHWSFVYLPADRANYHNEIAVRAASIAALNSIYPTT